MFPCALACLSVLSILTECVWVRYTVFLIRVYGLDGFPDDSHQVGDEQVPLLLGTQEGETVELGTGTEAEGVWGNRTGWPAVSCQQFRGQSEFCDMGLSV